MRLILQNWTLVLYWTLLMSLGPSFHHSEFWRESNVHQLDRYGIESSCCCCHHHRPAPKTATIRSQGDCVICQFFDSFDEVSYDFVIAACSQPTLHSFDLHFNQPCEIKRVPIARGPPAFACLAKAAAKSGTNA